MSVRLTWRVYDPTGTYRTTFAQYHACDYTIVAMPDAVGVAELELPPVVAPYLGPDWRLEPWRSIDGAPPYQDNDAVYLMRTFRYKAGMIAVTAYQAKSIMSRRLIAYPAGSVYADKAAAPADTQLLAFAREQLGTGIVSADRDGADTLADVSAYLTISSSPGLGASVAKAAARRVLLEVAAELCQASTMAGTYLTFDIVGTGSGGLVLRTYAVARGIDRRDSLMLAAARGTLEDDELTIDYADEATVTIAGGSGEKADRKIQTALDTSRMAASPFGRIERFVDMGNVDTDATLADEADAALWIARPTTVLTGTLRETDVCIRGIDVDLGDIVAAQSAALPGQTFTMRIESVRETWRGGKRTPFVGLRSVV